MEIQVKTRLAFEHVMKASAGPNGGEPSYSVMGLIDKADEKQIDLLNKTIEQVAKGKWGAKAATILQGLKAQDRICVHDGDLKPYDGFADHVYVSASNKTRPLVIDRRCNPVGESDGLIYSGCYAIIQVDIWAQDNQFGKRINASLKGVQFVRHGDAFTGGSPAKVSDFKDLGDEDEDGLDDLI